MSDTKGWGKFERNFKKQVDNSQQLPRTEEEKKEDVELLKKAKENLSDTYKKPAWKNGYQNKNSTQKKSASSIEDKPFLKSEIPLPDIPQQEYIGHTDMKLFTKPNAAGYRLNIQHELIAPKYKEFREKYGIASIVPSTDERDEFENNMIGELIREGLITIIDVYDVDKRNEEVRQAKEKTSEGMVYKQIPRNQCGNPFCIKKERPEIFCEENSKKTKDKKGIEME